MELCCCASSGGPPLDDTFGFVDCVELVGEESALVSPRSVHSKVIPSTERKVDEGYYLYVQFLSIFVTSLVLVHQLGCCWASIRIIGKFRGQQLLVGVNWIPGLYQMADEPSEDLQRSDLSEESELLARHRKEVKDLRGA